jgi:hypothetical protein
MLSGYKIQRWMKLGRLKEALGHVSKTVKKVFKDNINK